MQYFFARGFFLLLAILLILQPVGAHAQSSAGAEILTKPLDELVAPGDVIDRTITLKNVSKGAQTFFFSVADIVDVRDDESPIFAEPNSAPTEYELATWISVPTDSLTLLPGQSAPIAVKITVPQSASPGSHFAEIFAGIEAPRMRQNGAAVGYKVGTIVNLRIKGEANETARIRSFATDRLVFGKPSVTFTTRVENPGNVLIKPHGPLEIYNMFGKRIALINVNDNMNGVFPGHIRPFVTTWDEKDFAFGRYQGIVSLIYGNPGRETTVSATVSFWVLPINIILPFVGILAFLILAVYFGVRLHIKRTLNSYNISQRRSGYRKRDAGVTRLTFVAVSLLLIIGIFLIVMLVVFA